MLHAARSGVFTGVIGMRGVRLASGVNPSPAFVNLGRAASTVVGVHTASSIPHAYAMPRIPGLRWHPPPACW